MIKRFLKFALVVTLGYWSLESYSEQCHPKVARYLELSAAKGLDDLNTQTCLKNVPANFLEHPDFFDLILDPDQGRVTKQSVREAMAAIQLVWEGRVQGPVKRGIAGGFADFTDTLGSGFDIKAYSSARSEKGKAFDPFLLLKDIEKKQSRSFKNVGNGKVEKIKIFVDLAWLNSKDRAALEETLSGHLSAEAKSSVQYFELPEPQLRFSVAN